jgi:hypothetical protein
MYCDLAAASWARPAASRDSACVASVLVTSPTLKRSRLWQLFLQHHHVAPVQLEGRRIAQQIL